MLHESDKPQRFSSKEKPVREVMVEFFQEEHYNALISEYWCPFHIRKQLALEPARTRHIIVLCETDEEALRTAQWHFCRHGSNFKIINNGK